MPLHKSSPDGSKRFHWYSTPTARRNRPASSLYHLWLKAPAPLGADVSTSRALLSRDYRPGQGLLLRRPAAQYLRPPSRVEHYFQQPAPLLLELNSICPHHWKPLSGTHSGGFQQGG